MKSLYSRTSLTIDEAVANLLGWLEGPEDFLPIGDDISQEHEDFVASMTYSLHEELVEGLQDCRADLAEAGYDHAPKSRIVELQARCSQYEQRIDLANRCRCLVEEELFKNNSAFTRDPNRSTASNPYITIASLERWAESNPAIKEIRRLTGIHCDIYPSAASQPEKTGPHWTPDSRDPEAKQTWYTPARYFARQLIAADTSLRAKRDQLAKKVAVKLTEAGVYKRGGKKGFEPGTILKALSNVDL